MTKIDLIRNSLSAVDALFIIHFSLLEFVAYLHIICIESKLMIGIFIRRKM